MSNVILKKDTSAMEWAARDLREELEQMQGWIDFFNGLHYVTPINDLATAKEFLRDTKAYHDREVEKFLRTKTPDLPPNLKPLRDQWNIESCDDANFSEGNPRFEYLEMVDGQLQYAQNVYAAIEADHTVIATPEQVQALRELNKLWANLEQLSEILFPTPGHSRSTWYNDVIQPISILRHHIPGHTPDPSLLTPWKVEALEKLADGGFGQSKKTK